ncbi:MAG: hypothetical protein Salg2KO_07610 [Salibacteraceae bacterium]
MSLVTKTRAQNNWNWNQQHYFADTNSESAGLWMSAEYEILSNRISNEIINQALFDGKITPDATAYLDEYISNDYTRLSAGVSGEFWFRSAGKGNWRALVGIGFRDGAFASARTGLAQLYLRGNGPYEDQVMDLGFSSLVYHSYQFAGGGFERSFESTSFGLTAHMVKSSRFTELNVDQSGLYTAPFGTSIEADLNFTYDNSDNAQGRLGAWYGPGYLINGYLEHRSEKNGSLVTIQLRDIGQVFYKGVDRWKMSDSLMFNGVDADNILQLDDSLINGGSLDSLEGLLGLRQTRAFKRISMPAHVQVNYVMPMGDRSSLNVQLRQYLSMGLPELRVGYAIRLAPWFTLEPNIRAGGFSRFDVGLTAAINAKDRLSVILKTEQFETIIAPAMSTSQYMFLGGQLRF